MWFSLEKLQSVLQPSLQFKLILTRKLMHPAPFFFSLCPKRLSKYFPTCKVSKNITYTRTLGAPLGLGVLWPPARLGCHFCCCLFCLFCVSFFISFFCPFCLFLFFVVVVVFFVSLCVSFLYFFLYFCCCLFVFLYFCICVVLYLCIFAFFVLSFCTVQYGKVQYSTVTGEEDGVRGWLTPYSIPCVVSVWQVLLVWWQNVELTFCSKKHWKSL